MRNIFSFDGHMMQTLKKIMYLTATNLLFVLCSLPVITMGASFTAMSVILMRIAEGDEPPVISTFVKAFKENFKNSTWIWLLVLAGIASLALNVFMLADDVKNNVIFRVLFWGVCLILVFLGVYIFPVIGYYKNSIKGYLHFSLLLAVVQLPKTIILIILQMIPVVLFLLACNVSMFALTFLLCGFSLPAYLASKILKDIFPCYGGQPCEE